MKKLGVRILTFLLCIFLLIPQGIVKATESTENTESSEEGTETADEDKDNNEEDIDEDKEKEDNEGDTEKDGETVESGEENEDPGDDTKEEAVKENEDESEDSDDEEEKDKIKNSSYPEEIEVSVPASVPNGSGSYQLNEVPTDYRFYTEYFVEAESKKSTSTAGVDRRTSIRVYAKKDEVIFFGSSVSHSQIDENNKRKSSPTGVDIVITKPNGEKVKEDVLEPGEKMVKATYNLTDLDI